MLGEKQRYHIIYIFGTLVGTLLSSVATESSCQYGLSVEVPDCSLEGITCLNEANNLFEDGNFSRGNDAWLGPTVVPDGLQVDIGTSLSQSVYTPCAGEYVITLEARTHTSVSLSCGATDKVTRLIEGESCPDFMMEGNTVIFGENWKIYQCKIERQDDNEGWAAYVYAGNVEGGDDSSSLIIRYAHLLMLPSTACAETATPTSTPSPSCTPTSTSSPSASITSWKAITSSATTTVTMTSSTSGTSMPTASSTSSLTKTSSPTQTRTSTTTQTGSETITSIPSASITSWKTITSSATPTLTMISSTSGTSMSSANSTSSPMPTKTSSPTQTRTSTTTQTGSETMTSKSLPSSSVTTSPSPSATCSYTQPKAPTSTHTASKALASNNETFSPSHLATSSAMWTANEVERAVTPTTRQPKHILSHQRFLALHR